MTSVAAARLAATLLVGFLLIRFSSKSAIKLRLWGVAWLCLALQVLGGPAEAAAAPIGPPSLLFHLSALASAIGGFGYPLCLVLGAWELSGTPMRARFRTSLLVVASTFAGLSFLSLYVDPQESRLALYARFHLPIVARAIACAVVAGRLALDRPRFATGRWLVLVSLALQGLSSLIQLAIRVGRPDAPAEVSLAGVVIAGVLGLGMIACLLDHDQQELVRASAEAVRASSIDALTGLSNQAAFVRLAERRLSEAGRGETLGVIFLALSRLGGINHSLGHGAGDRVLRASAERLRASLRDGDEVGRVGGDEFAILVGGAMGPDDILAVARKLEEVMRWPFEIGGRELNVTASIGLSVFPDDASDAEALIDQACTAAYRVKGGMGGRIGIYSKGMNADALERLSLEHDLRQAIDRNELVLYFQPLFRLPGATVRGFEALLRWRHPRFGLIGAETVISLAESTGLIHTIGRWALHTACAQIAALRESGGAEVPRLSVNVSAHQLMAPDLVLQVASALRESGLPGSHLEIEITESAAIDNVQTAREHLHRLKDMGVSIAIDDFGTGYSSLAYLRNLPLDTIKIDRSFIRDIAVDLGDGALVTTIIALAQGRDLSVVAEGVETEEQLRFLISRGCDYAQGYLLARPLPPEELDGGRRMVGPAEFGRLLSSES